MTDPRMGRLREHAAPDLWPEIERRLGQPDGGVHQERSPWRTRLTRPSLVLSVFLALALVASGIWALTTVGQSPRQPESIRHGPPIPGGTITRIPVDRPYGPPQPIAVGEGAAWVVVGTSGGGNVVYRIDEQTNQAKALPQTRGAIWVAAGHGAAWASACLLQGRNSCRQPVVLRLDPGTGATQATIALSGYPGTVAVGEGAVWVSAGERLARIDPAVNLVTDVFDVCCSVWGAAYGSVWMTNLNQEGLLRVDPSTGEVVARFAAPRGDACRAAVGAGHVWLASCISIGSFGDRPDLIERIDPVTNEVLNSRDTNAAVHIAAGAGFLWLVEARDNATGITLTRVDPNTDRRVGIPLTVPYDPGGPHYVTTGPSAGPPLFLAVSAQAVWISDFRDGQVIRVQLPLG